MERLRELCIGYKREDIWNEDETGCFFRALPDKSLPEEERRCKGGKKTKLRMTVAFFVNAKGEKKKSQLLSRKARTQERQTNARKCYLFLKSKILDEFRKHD